MESGDGSRPDPSTRRSGRYQFPGLGALRSAAEPAFSVRDRLRHVHQAPLKNLRRSIWWARKTFLTKPRTETPAYLVELSESEVVRLFGTRHFEPGWDLSYNYHGEVVNLRRTEYVDHEQYNWWQVHLRGFRHEEGGVELTAHYETEPAEHPDAHVRLYGLDVEKGMTALRDVLDEAGVDYEFIGPEARTGT